MTRYTRLRATKELVTTNPDSSFVVLLTQKYCMAHEVYAK